MRILALAFLLIAASAGAAGYETNFIGTIDQTPGMSTGNTNWFYPETPGTYYWNGVRTAFVMGFFCLAIGAGVRYWARE